MQAYWNAKDRDQVSEVRGRERTEVRDQRRKMLEFRD